MKKSKAANRDTNKYLANIPPNIRYYLKVAAIAGGMAGMFWLGYWLISLFDRGNSNNTADRPINVPITTPAQPSNSIPTATPTPTITNTPGSTENKPSIPTTDRAFTYKLIGQTAFKQPSPKLQQVVNSIVAYSKEKNLPLNALSITLIDTKTSEKADYQGNVQRYPASVVKLFWLVTAYQKISQGELDEKSLRHSIEQMIYKSDNQGASQVIDAVTQTKSNSEKLAQTELALAKQQRQTLNTFFSQAGYSENINVSQKTFPIPQENIMEPKGFDRQLRGDNLQQPIRNKLTTNDAARLMYEIVDARSIDPDISKKMRGLLTRNINPDFWKKQPPNPVDFNPVESFFGEGLPVTKIENIVSKAGWTSASRQEVAFIKSKDGKTRYILAVFGDDAAYGKSKKIFPEISNLVYKQIRKL